VTRAATRLVLGAPVRTRQAIELFDVTGRRVRSLELPSGAVSAAWDGRSAQGAPVPAGVYFARVPGADRAAAARIVVIR
jgi:hypothetical protein